jgi:hypothetical protein
MSKLGAVVFPVLAVVPRDLNVLNRALIDTAARGQPRKEI